MRPRSCLRVLYIAAAASAPRATSARRAVRCSSGGLVTLLESVEARLDEELRGPGVFPIADVATSLHRVKRAQACLHAVEHNVAEDILAAFALLKALNVFLVDALVGWQESVD